MNAKLQRFNKKASIGSSPDVPFEQAFASIAHEYLQSRVPTLMDKEIGFQLVDKSKDGDKALGVFGFKLGERELMIPVIYRNGEVKGHEVCYVPDQDMVLPTTEGWMNYLQQKQNSSLGEGVNNNRSALGIKGPLLNLITRSPLKLANDNTEGQKVLSKYATWSHPFILMIAKLAKQSDNERMAACPSAGYMLRAFPWQTQCDFMHMLDEFPGLKLAMEKVDPDFGIQLKETVEITASALEKERGQLITKVDSKKQQDPLKVISYSEAAKALVPYDLSDADKSKLAEKGYIVHDKRDTANKPKLHINIDQAETQALGNPTGNSIASVVMRPFDFERCVVITDPVGTSEKKRETLVIPLDGKDLLVGDRNSVFVQDDPTDTQEMLKFLDSLPLAKNYKFSEDNSSDGSWHEYILLQPQNDSFFATAPFSFDKDYGKQGDHRILGVSFCGGMYNPTTSIGLSDGDRKRLTKRDRLRFDTGPSQIRITESGRIRMYAGEVVVPETSRVLKITRKWSSPRGNGRGKELGSLRDTTTALWRNLTKLEVTRGGNKGREFRFNTLKPMEKSAAMIHLVRDYRLDEADAARLLDSLEPGKSIVAGIEKSANDRPSWLNDNGNSETPDLPWNTPTGSNIMANPNMENDTTVNYRLPVEGLMSGKNDPSVWDPMNEPDIPSMQQAMGAAQKGQRDVMSTKSVLAIANKSQSNALGPIVKAIDALGRRYIGFCWQRDAMEDQYGSADANDIESGLLENVESLGELVISMYERNVKAGDHTALLKSRMTINSEDEGEEE